MHLSSPTFHFFDNFRRKADTLPDILTTNDKIAPGEMVPEWTVIDGMVLHVGRVGVVAADPGHGGRHKGVQKTLHRLCTSFSPPPKTEDVILLQDLEMSSSVWANIAMDFNEGFLRFGDKSVILTVFDRFSKYVYFISLGHPYTTTSVARAFFDQVVRLHGVSCSIVSSRDPVFTSSFGTKLFNLMGVNLRMSTTFLPQTNG